MKGFLYGQTEYNILSSAVKLDDYINKASLNGFDYLSITDRYMYGVYKFYNKCKAKNIKPIIGLEYRYLNSLLREDNIILYAKNNEGFNDLIKISNEVTLNNRNDIDLIIENKKNLLIIFPFNDSIFEEYYQNENLESLKKELKILNDCDGYIGIPYTNKDYLYDRYCYLADFLNENGYKSLPIHKMVYLEPEDSKVYEVLTEIDGNKVTINPLDDYSFLVNPDSDPKLDEIIKNINLNIYNKKMELPKFKDTKGVSSYEYLQALCFKGLEKRKINYKNYADRLRYELSVIHKMNYDDYFLIVWDFIRYSKKSGILVGPGRGSAAGSLVAYTLGITDVDPLKYDVLFERFLTPERISMPDIDTDFPDKDRDKVIEYVRDLYSKDHVCNITTFNTFQIKSSIRDLAKIMKFKEDKLDQIIDMTVRLGYDAVINDYKDRDPELAEFVTICKKLENLPRSIGTHAAGIIISSKSLLDLVPLRDGINNVYQSMYEAADLEAIGLLKMDFLGLSNLSFIDDTIKMIPNFNQTDLRNIPLDDSNVYRMISNGDTFGVFQLESAGIRKTLMNLKPSCLDDLVAVLALFRPGPMDNIPTYIARKHGEKFEYLHKDLEPILKNTYGIIVYQEQIMKIAQVFAGYSLSQADVLRKAVSKKNEEALLKSKNDFINNSVRRGYSSDIANSIYDLILKFANYGFNKSHSVAYGIFAYQMAWLKYHYFKEFMTTILNKSIGDKVSLEKYISYAKSRNLIIDRPNINISESRYVINNGVIYIPFNHIYSLGIVSSNKIVEERNNGLFKSIEDFKTRCQFLSKKDIEALIFSGALDVFNKTKKDMIEQTNEEDIIFNKHMKLISSNVDYDFDYLQKQELNYLGYNFRYNLFVNKFEIIRANNLTEIAKLRFNVPAGILARFSDINEIKTKNNELMSLGDIEDDVNKLKYVIFSKQYVNLKTKPNKNNLFILYGQLKKDNKNEDSFYIDSMRMIE
jgi:DNA polymerase-3 subunit alpha